VGEDTFAPFAFSCVWLHSKKDIRPLGK